MPEPAVHLIVFSKDRPLQLHGYLCSVFRHWYGDLRVSVLLRPEAPYFTAYGQMMQEFGGVHYQHERDFASDLLALVEDTDEPLLCFGCDDAVYVAPVLTGTLTDLFEERRDLLGVSLRLGQNVKRGMFGQPMPQPTFVPDPRGPTWEAPPRPGGLLWDATAPDAVGDWAYPWEVVGTVYRTPFVRRMVHHLSFENPSTLEHAGSLVWREHAEGRTMLRAWHRSRLVLPTVNVVQSVFGNGIVGPAGLDPEFLLDCWDRGLRLDVQRFSQEPTDTWRTGDLYLRRAP
jgi:hypothetical protein